MLANTLHGGIAKVLVIAISVSAYTPLKAARGRRRRYARAMSDAEGALMKFAFGRRRACLSCRLDFVETRGSAFGGAASAITVR
jgi:hypothetical protein